MIELVIGGARSGKSSFAQQKAEAEDRDVIFIATATRIDEAMAERISRHIQQRPCHWQTIEEPVDLAKTLTSLADFNGIILIDCLTLWLNNILYEDINCDLMPVLTEFTQALHHCRHVILVSNEVGLGIIPMGEICQRFVDESGRMNQLIAKQADRVTFMVAGLPMIVKGAK